MGNSFPHGVPQVKTLVRIKTQNQTNMMFTAKSAQTICGLQPPQFNRFAQGRKTSPETTVFFPYQTWGVHVYSGLVSFLPSPCGESPVALRFDPRNVGPSKSLISRVSSASCRSSDLPFYGRLRFQYLVPCAAGIVAFVWTPLNQVVLFWVKLTPLIHLNTSKKVGL